MKYANLKEYTATVYPLLYLENLLFFFKLFFSIFFSIQFSTTCDFSSGEKCSPVNKIWSGKWKMIEIGNVAVRRAVVKTFKFSSAVVNKILFYCIHIFCICSHSLEGWIGPLMSFGITYSNSWKSSRKSQSKTQKLLLFVTR